MGFNKRIFSLSVLSRYFKEDEENGIGKSIGKTDGFIFNDEESRIIVDLWIRGKKDEARQKLKDVLRIIS